MGDNFSSHGSGNLITPPDMKWAAAITFVSIVLVSQAFAVLRPVYPSKSAPPISSERIVTGNDLIQRTASKPSATTAR
jgi:hypothetical protein